ncbi:MAG: glycosyltransferase, partial [Clostridium sp.]|uniref:glycosyltransferase n=1 Tax=Clostridium sp. TaxID=1506 RepID=UPI003EE6A391
KGVITGPNTKHISYVHSPMRYAWDLYHDYKKRSGKLTRFFMSIFMKSLREWDYSSSQRIDIILANSNYVAKRINKFWNRECKVVYPPVDIDRLSPNGKDSEDFYVVFSRFVPYKRIDLAIEACKKLGRKLVVIGDGEQREYLKSLADENITFTGRISDEEVKNYLQRCKAMIFCAEEDFGIVPLEAQACGRPVIAYGKGGALETVVDKKTGIFFDKQEVESIVKGIGEFEKLDLNTQDIYKHAMKFSRERFKKEIEEVVKDK